MKEPGLG